MKRACLIVWILLVLFSIPAESQTLWREIPLGETSENFYYLQMRSSGRGPAIFQRLVLIKKVKETLQEVERLVMDTPSYVEKGDPGMGEYLRGEGVTYFNPLSWYPYFLVEDGIVFSADGYREQILSADSLALQAPKVASGDRVVGLYMSSNTQAGPQDKLYLVVQTTGEGQTFINSEFIVALPQREVVQAFATAESHRQEGIQRNNKD